MKILKYTLFFFLNTLCISAMNAQVWTSYQSQERINDLVDTGTELIMATEMGLVVMNKSTLQKGVYTKANAGLSKNHIISVEQAPNGDVWVGTENGSIERFDGTNFQDAAVPNHANFNTAQTKLFDLKIAPNGDFWCATNDGVFHKQGQNWLHYGSAELGANFFEAWDIAINNAGEVFIATRKISKFANGVWTSITGSSALENYLDSDLFISSTGDVFMSGDLSNIGRFNGTQWTTYTSPINGSEVKGFAEGTNGDIYLYTTFNGVYKLVGTTWTPQVDAQTQAAADRVTYLHIDAQNKRWLNHNIHLSVNDAGTIQSALIAPHTLETNSSRKMFMRDNGSTYFVTYSRENIAMKDAAGNWSFLPAPVLSNMSDNFTDIVVFSDTDIWLSSDQSLFQYDGTTWTEKISEPCRSMTTDSQGKIFIRSSLKIYVVTNGVVTEYNSSNSPISGPYISGHGVDANDNLWVSEGNTIIRKRTPGGVWTEYTQANHPDLNKPKGDFHFDVNGNVWVPCDAYGAIKFDGTTFTNPYTGNLSEMENYEVSSIESDATGKMYFAHQYGMTTLFNGQWRDILISDVPQTQSIASSFIEFDNAGNIWWASLRYGVFSFGAPAILPVDLTDLRAETMGEASIEISWQTASEINNDYFSIEHSTDGSNFREIAKQNGRGTTTAAQNYAHTHEKLAAGQHYYRLKQIDFDGRFEYTDIVTARIKTRKNEMSLMPNPTSGIVSLKTKNAVDKATDLQVINTQGQIVFSAVLQSGEENLTLDISDLPLGIYYLRMAVGSDLMTKRIVKTQ